MFPTGRVSFLLLLLPVPQLPSCVPGFCGSMYLLLVRLLFDFVIKHDDWRMLFEFKPDVFCRHFLITLRWWSGLSPDPSSCGSFLQCAGDELHTIHCPPGGTSSFFKILSKCQALLLTQCQKSSYHCSPGLLFNTATVQCDWPDNVDCSSSASSTTASPGSSQPSSTTSPPQSSTTSKASTTTRKPTTTTTEGTNTKNPPVQGEEVLTCAGRDTSEPISEEVKKLRETTCSLDNSQVTLSPCHCVLRQYTHQVEKVVPGRLNNPPNVRLLESVLSSKLFDSFFPRAHSAYT